MIIIDYELAFDDPLILMICSARTASTECWWTSSTDSVWARCFQFCCCRRRRRHRLAWRFLVCFIGSLVIRWLDWAIHDIYLAPVVSCCKCFPHSMDDGPGRAIGQNRCGGRARSCLAGGHGSSPQFGHYCSYSCFEQPTAAVATSYLLPLSFWLSTVVRDRGVGGGGGRRMQ